MIDRDCYYGLSGIDLLEETVYQRTMKACGTGKGADGTLFDYKFALRPVPVTLSS